MEQSMSDQLRMSYQPSLLNLTDATFLQGSGSGITHSPEPDGRTIDECGPDLALASLSPRQAKEMGLLTSGTYGLRGSTLSSSADLARSLVSRYRAKTRSVGSTLFTLTWKVRYTPSERPIFAVRASGLRISDRDCTSWPSPVVNDSVGSDYAYNRGNHDSITLKLGGVAKLTNWRSPSASDGEGGVKDPMSEKYANADAPKFKLRDQASLASTHGPNQGTDRLPGAADLAGWMTPAVTNIDPTEDRREKRTAYRNSIGRQDCPGGLSEQAVMVTDSWATPTANDHKGSGPTVERKDGKIRNDRLDYQTEQFGPAQLTDSGEMPSGSIAETGNGVLSGQLNPGHSRWLMSLPPIWDVCGIRAADAIRSRLSSKKAKDVFQDSVDMAMRSLQKSR